MNSLAPFHKIHKIRHLQILSVKTNICFHSYQKSCANEGVPSEVSSSGNNSDVNTCGLKAFLWHSFETKSSRSVKNEPFEKVKHFTKLQAY